MEKSVQNFAVKKPSSKKKKKSGGRSCGVGGVGIWDEKARKVAVLKREAGGAFSEGGEALRRTENAEKKVSKGKGGQLTHGKQVLPVGNRGLHRGGKTKEYSSMLENKLRPRKRKKQRMGRDGRRQRPLQKKRPNSRKPRRRKNKIPHRSKSMELTAARPSKAARWRKPTRRP